MTSRPAVEHPAPNPRQRDEGSALAFTLVFMMLGTLMILPLINYTSSVLSSGQVQKHKSVRSEVVRGNLRLALADGAALYKACAESGLHTPVVLASPNLGVPVHTECTTLADAAEVDDDDLKVAMATVQVGSSPPLDISGTPYVNSGAEDPTLWWADISNESQGGKIFLPLLPTHALKHPATGGYMMPSWAGSCRVFFPGTYSDPVTISDATPTFFTSGIYYFENTVTFSGPANVVIGEGAIEGCTNNAEAAFYADNAPSTVNISGIGATFVFGASGRLVVTDGGGAMGPSVQFNSRLTDPTDVGNSVSKGVSIVTVNGVSSGPSSSDDLNIPERLSVPKSLTEEDPGDSTAPVDAASAGYLPSTLVPSVSPDPPVPPVIDISLTGSGTSLLFVPGYVGVPQGAVQIAVTAGEAVATKTVQLVGGVLAALVIQTPDPPASVDLGLVNRVVQKTFKLIARTTTGNPSMVSVAIVQVNDFGEFAVNSWVTTTGSD